LIHKRSKGKEKRKREVERETKRDDEIIEKLKQQDLSKYKAKKDTSNIQLDEKIDTHRDEDYMPLFSGDIPENACNFMIRTSKDVLMFYLSWAPRVNSASKKIYYTFPLKDLHSQICITSCYIDKVKFKVDAKGKKSNQLIVTVKFNNSTKEEQEETNRENAEIDYSQPMDGEKLMGMCV